jgi:hypothetical protein
MSLVLLVVPFVLSIIGLSPLAQTDARRLENPEKIVIKMERYECFGFCPVYSVEIHGDGTVIYQGKKFVRVKGKQVFKIPVVSVMWLVREFEKINYFSLAAEYVTVVNEDGTVTTVSDLPGTDTWISLNGKTKSVYDYFGGPDSLRELERKIDDVSESARFVKKGF